MACPPQGFRDDLVNRPLAMTNHALRHAVEFFTQVIILMGGLKHLHTTAVHRKLNSELSGATFNGEVECLKSCST